MRTLPLNSAYIGFLPYQRTTPVQRAQALAHTQHLLLQRFPMLTKQQQWADLFAEYRPTLWVDEAAQEAVVEEESLVGMANWINLYQLPDQEDTVPLYEHETCYLVRTLVWYTEQAKDLLATDPELTKPESIGQMRALFQRLSVGNSVAERIHRACQRSGDQAHSE